VSQITEILLEHEIKAIIVSCSKRISVIWLTWSSLMSGETLTAIGTFDFKFLSFYVNY
jgi:hypothetical protein